MSSSAIATPVVRLRSRDVPPVVEVERGAGVPDLFWLRVLGEWGAQGRQTDRAITVGQDRFLARLAWLPQACRRSGVGLDLDDRTRELIVRQRDESERLAAIREGVEPLEAAAVVERLRGSRFDPDVLRPFQVRDLGRLLTLQHGANFSVPGAGKTAVTYAVYEAERAAGRVNQLLVIAPLSAFEAWQTEAARWLDPPPDVRAGRVPEVRTEVLVSNYHRLALAYDELAAWAAAGATHVVLDEAHRMKRGRAGQWGSASLNLAQLAIRRDVLTGTPAPQHPRDLVALLDFCWPGHGRRLVPAAALARVPDPDVMPQLQDAVRPLFVRTTKRELGLPEPSFHLRLVALDGLQAEIYDALRTRVVDRFAATAADLTNFARMGRIVMYLLEAATNPALLPAGSAAADTPTFQHPALDIPPGSRLAELIADFGRYEPPRKFIELGQIVRDNAEAGRKTLVWSNFVRNLEQLALRVMPGLQPALIHGGIPHDDPDAPRSRVRELARFRRDTDCHVLLANPAALGEGVSLHDVCRDAVYVDRTFNAGQYLQSLDRIHRLGLGPDDEVVVTLLLSAGTIDEVVDARVREKATRLAAMLDDPELTTFALPDEEDYGLVVDTEEDLAQLFAHLRGDGTDG